MLVAAPQGEGWLVDDLVLGDPCDGPLLWNAFADACGGEDVRFVAPTYEPVRTELALDAGLALAESWWLVELDSGGGESEAHVELPGAAGVVVNQRSGDDDELADALEGAGLRRHCDFFEGDVRPA